MAKKKTYKRHREAKKKTKRRPKRRSYKDPVYKAWRTKVFRRDGYKCQICSRSNEILHAHHIKPFCVWPKLELSVKNGITLCKTCHMKLHEKIGCFVDSEDYIKKAKKRFRKRWKKKK